jgi:hypothetical protein
VGKEKRKMGLARLKCLKRTEGMLFLVGLAKKGGGKGEEGAICGWHPFAKRRGVS